MPWYARWFADESYTAVYRHRDETEALQAVDLFFAATGLDPTVSRILDLACGTGRHAMAFARHRARVVAADLSPTLLAVARRGLCANPAPAAGPRLVRCDMRRLPFRPAMDGVVQLFTAFGYFATDAEDASVLAGVARVLRPGGWYMLDFLNADEVRARIEPRSETPIPGGSVVQERWIAGDRVEKRIAVTRGGALREFRESVRLYARGDLERMLGAAGLAVRSVAGSYSGDAFHPASPRCILFAQLPS